MNNFIKQIIEEKFASKAQQRFFYAKANEKGTSKKEKKKWNKWANEFSSETNFDKIPDKVKKKKTTSDQKEEEFNEIIDDKGNLTRSKKPTNFNTKGITQNKTSDEVVKSVGGSMGTHGVHGTHTTLRYWAESDMSKSLGFNDTMAQDVDYDDAENYFEKDLGIDDKEAEERLNQMGYDKNLPDDKVRLVENPKKFIEEYIDSLVNKKSTDNEIVPKEIKEINPIIKKQIKSLKQSIDSNNLTIDDVIKYLKDNE
ncbi:MAG: hypothetical protein E6R13_04745 [Spirochaetes bacterium]|nr:MAG: hypothetical protein E6R13_04745 [Spirochaetota bacterium]